MSNKKYFEEADIAIDPILKWLEPNPNLPDKVVWIPHEIARLSYVVIQLISRNPERTVGLRHLLDAKDALVRAALD